jgi:hypothetical protein
MDHQSDAERGDFVAIGDVVQAKIPPTRAYFEWFAAVIGA